MIAPKDGNRSRQRPKHQSIYLTADDVSRALNAPVLAEADASEMAVLGSLLYGQTSDVLSDTDDLIGPQDFRLTKHATIYEAMRQTAGSDGRIDIVSVTQQLVDAGTINEVGGAEYLQELCESVPSESCARHYAGLVAKASRRRSCTEALGRATWRCVEGKVETDELLADTLRELDELEANGSDPVQVYKGIQDCADIDWLWPKWLPRGMPSILAAEPATGKSYAAINIAAKLSKASQWPDGQKIVDCGSTLYFSREMDLKYNIGPRYAAAGGEPGCLAVDSSAIDIGDFPTVLRRKVRAHARAGNPPVRLVVIDPIGSYLAGSDSNSYSDVYGLMAEIAEAACAVRVAVLLVFHLNKRGPGKAGMDRLMGSQAWRGASRTIWAMERDTDDDGDEVDGALRLTLAESNIGPVGDSIPFELIKPPGARFDQMGIRWGEAEKRKRADVLRENERPRASDRRTDERRRVGELCASLLAKGPVSVGEVLIAAKPLALDPSQSTIKRELTTLGAVSRPAGFGQPWKWSYPPSEKELNTLNTLDQTDSVVSSRDSHAHQSGQAGQSVQVETPPP